jgi:rhodanese-related sulfurtransferase
VKKVDRSLIRAMAVLVLFPLLPAAVNILVSPNRPAWNPMTLAENEVTVEQVQDWQEPYLLIDARSPIQYAAAHAPGALNLYEGNFDYQIVALLDQWRPEIALIVYCDSRQCGSSKVVAEKLKNEFQMDHVFVLKGGWERWECTTRES